MGSLPLDAHAAPDDAPSLRIDLLDELTGGVGELRRRVPSPYAFTIDFVRSMPVEVHGA